MHDGSRENNRKTWTSAAVPDGVPAVSAEARGLRYGDGVFVTLGIRGGVLLDAAFQLNRLRDAAQRIGLRPPAQFERSDEALGVLVALLEELGATADTDATVRLQWFAGPGARGFVRGDVGAEAILDLGPAPEAGRPAVVVLDEHEAPLPALPRLKSCSALGPVMCERSARALGADTGIRTWDGLVLETGSANVFWLDRHGLRTPSARLPLYAGSVREQVIRCARDAGLAVEEGEFVPKDLRRAETLLLTNAARGVEVAASLDGRALPEPTALAIAIADAVAARREADGLPLGAA